MNFHVYNYATRAEAQNWAEATVLEELLTARVASFASGYENEDVSFFWYESALTRCFETGMLEFILTSLQARGVSNIQIHDHRTPPDSTNYYPHADPKFTPYEDQRSVAEQMIARGRGVCDLATNYGKTVLVAHVLHSLNMRSALILVPTQALLHQTSVDLENWLGLQEGEIGRVGDTRMDWKPITVAVTDSVYMGIKNGSSLPHAFASLIVDEGHLQVATKVQTVAAHTDAFYRWWLSGTAYKDDTEDHAIRLTGLAGPLLARVDNKYLVQAGRSALPIIQYVRFREAPGGGLDVASKGAQAYKVLKKHEGRNRLIADIVNAAALQNLVTLVFVEHKDQMQELKPLMPWAECVMGAQPRVNQRIREKLEDRRLLTVIATSAWRVGVSIPLIDHIIHAGGNKSTANILQEFGRVLRRKEYNGNRCYYTDIYDEWQPQGQRHSARRWSIMSKQGFPVSIIDPSQVRTMFSISPSWVQNFERASA